MPVLFILIFMPNIIIFIIVRCRTNPDLIHSLQQVMSPADRKSTRLNSSHGYISYAVFCLKKKTYKIVVKQELLALAVQSNRIADHQTMSCQSTDKLGLRLLRRAVSALIRAVMSCAAGLTW